MHCYLVAIDVLKSHIGLSVDEAIDSINLPINLQEELKALYVECKKEPRKHSDE